MKVLYPTIIGSKELYTTAKRICTTIVDEIIEDPYIDMIVPKLKSHIEALSKVLGRTNDPKAVEILDKKSGELNLRFISFRDHCKACLTDIDENIVNTASRIVEIIREIGWSLHLEGNVKKSSLISALIIRMEKVPCSEAITTINASARFNALKTAHLDFESTYLEKIDAKTREIYPKVYDCRRYISRYLGALLNYIDIMDEMKGAIFSIAANKIDVVITEAESIARARRTRKRKQKSDVNGEIGLMS